MIMLGTQALPVSWRDWETRWGVPHAHIEGDRLLRSLKTPGRAAVANKRLRNRAKSRGFHGTHMLSVSVADQLLVQPLRRIVCRALTPPPTMSKAACQWLRGKLRIAVGKLPTLKDMWNHRTFSRSCTLASAAAIKPRRLRETRQRGSGCNALRSAGVPRAPLTCDEGVRSVRNGAASIFHRLPPGLRAAAKATDRDLDSVASKLRLAGCEDSLDAADRVYTDDLAVPEGSVGVQDDKDVKVAWTMPEQTYVRMFWSMIPLSKAWSLTTLNHAEAERIQRQTVRDRLPPRLRLSVPFGRKVTLPSVHLHFKSKCFRAWKSCPSEPKSCKKPGHSCARRITSHARFPGRPLWRAVSRCFQICLMLLAWGCEVWKLPDLLPRLQSGVSALRIGHLGAYRCILRGRLKNPFEGLVADAGQFFEEVDPSAVMAAAEALADAVVESYQRDTVSVQRGPRVRGSIGGHTAVKPAKRQAFTLDEMLKTLDAALHARLVQMGDCIIWAGKLTIRGFMSKIATSIALAFWERLWAVMPELRALEDVVSPHDWLWEHAVCQLRYVDDLLMISLCICRACLMKILRAQYPVVMDVDDNPRDLPFLDVEFSLDALATEMPLVADTDSPLETCRSSRTLGRSGLLSLVVWSGGQSLDAELLSSSATLPSVSLNSVKRTTAGVLFGIPSLGSLRGVPVHD